MTEDQFLHVLKESQSRIEWYVDVCIRGRLRLEDDETHLCPITGVAWYLGHPLRQPSGFNQAAADLGLGEDLATTIVDAADDESDESCYYSMRQSLLQATDLGESNDYDKT